MCSSRVDGQLLGGPPDSFISFHASTSTARDVVPPAAFHAEKRSDSAPARLRTAVRKPDGDDAAARFVLGEPEGPPQVADCVVDQPQSHTAPVSLL